MLEYPNITSHNVLKNSKCEQNNMKNMEAYSEEVKLGNKSVKITLEFPISVDPKDAERFERNLRQVYINRVQTGSLQMAYSAVHSTPLNGKSESISRRNNQ